MGRVVSPQPIPNMSTCHPAQGRLVSCDYAGCTRLAETDIDGWQFCPPHLREHRTLTATDMVTARTRGPRPLPPPPADPWLRKAYSGERLPSRSWNPILDVLAQPDVSSRRHQVAS